MQQAILGTITDQTTTFYYADTDTSERVDFLAWCIREDVRRIARLEEKMQGLRSSGSIRQMQGRIAEVRWHLRQEMIERLALTTPVHNLVYLREVGLRFAGRHCDYCGTHLDGMGNMWVWSRNGEMKLYCYPSADCHDAANEAREQFERAERSLAVIEARETVAAMGKA